MLKIWLHGGVFIYELSGLGLNPVAVISLNIRILPLLLVSGPQVLYENPGGLKSLLGMNLSLANKNLFIILFIS